MLLDCGLSLLNHLLELCFDFDVFFVEIVGFHQSHLLQCVRIKLFFQDCHWNYILQQSFHMYEL